MIKNFKRFYIYTFLCVNFSTKKNKSTKELNIQDKVKKITENMVEKKPGKKAVKDKVKDKVKRKSKQKQAGEETIKNSFVVDEKVIAVIHSRIDFLYSVVNKLVVAEHKRAVSNLKSTQKPLYSKKVITVKKAKVKKVKEDKSKTNPNLKKNE